VGLPTFLLVLRELAHLHGGWLALEPRVEIKARLADHLYDDARAVAKLAAGSPSSASRCLPSRSPAASAERPPPSSTSTSPMGRSSPG